MEIIFSRILSVPIGGPPNGILVAPNKFVKKEKINHDRLFGAIQNPFGYT